MRTAFGGLMLFMAGANTFLAIAQAAGGAGVLTVLGVIAAALAGLTWGIGALYGAKAGQ